MYATEQEAVLQKSGIQLASLNPTQQEALLQQRGTEFLKSTGQLSSLEKRRVEQQARAGSMARGRLMDESGLYSEVQARMAEELGKQEREIALGSQLLGQEAGMRSNTSSKDGIQVRSNPVIAPCCIIENGQQGLLFES